jgi:hypothetical protein
MKLGVWSDFVDQVLIFNLVRYKPFTVMEIVEGTLILLLPLWWYWGLGILAGVKRIKEDTLTRVLVLMVVLTIPVILVRPYHHYWIQVIPMVTVLIYTSKRLINSRWWLMSLVAVYGFGGYMMYDKWQRIQALPRVEESKVLHCDNIEEILDYVVTDCKPAKFFYEVDGVSR